MATKKTAVKINSLELENVKRVKAVAITPTENGLTVLGGKNAQGKTSVLDAIAWALGGDRYKPSAPDREGSMVKPHLKVSLSNGVVVERSGKNSALKVIDSTGKKSGQTLLDSFISQLALDLPKFLNMSNRDKAKELLKIIGIGDQLDALDRKEQELYNRRLEIGRIRDQKKGAADEMVQWDGVPETPISATDLIQQQQTILARNGENQRKRDRLKEITFEKHRIFDEITRLESQLNDLQARITERKDAYEKVAADEEIAMTETAKLVDESTAELQKNLEEIEAINAKVSQNLAKAKAMDEMKAFDDQYKALSADIDNVRDERLKLLDGAKMPLDGLSVDHGELVYKGQRWDNMSSSEQLIVSTAIVKELKPECGFVLLDKLEQMDVDTMNEFGHWLEGQGLQAIATRVSVGEECSVIIEDGYSVVDGKKTAETDEKPAEAMKAPEPKTQPAAPAWKAGEF
jgi:hypothetical protein